MEQETSLKGFWFTLAIIAICFSFLKDASAQISPGFNDHSFQYLSGVLTPAQVTTTRVANAFNGVTLPRFYSMSVTTASTGAFQVALEGSLDNLNWTTVASTNSALGFVSNVNPFPLLYFRMRAISLPSNTSVTASAVGVW